MPSVSMQRQAQVRAPHCTYSYNFLHNTSEKPTKIGVSVRRHVEAQFCEFGFDVLHASVECCELARNSSFARTACLRDRIHSDRKQEATERGGRNFPIHIPNLTRAV